jgi:branched-chain amino acid transport system ATP-binding protein
MTKESKRSISESPALLKSSNLNTYYGPAHILFDVSLQVAQGEVVGLVGRNGVGKTTCLRSILGLTPPREGSIQFKGQEIARLPPFQIARLGIGYVPGDRRIFPDLTVHENLEIGASGAKKSKGGKPTRPLDWAYQAFPQLGPLRNNPGGKLSGGEQHMLAFARTLIMSPEMVLIDEPTEGLSPVAVKTLTAIVLELKAQGITMLISAPDLRFAMKVADRIYVMSRGEIVYTGTKEQVRRDEATIKKAHFVI